MDAFRRTTPTYLLSLSTTALELLFLHIQKQVCYILSECTMYVNVCFDVLGSQSQALDFTLGSRSLSTAT